MRIGKRALSLLLVLTLLLSVAPVTLAASNTYADVPSSHWASDVIAKWSSDDYGVLQGNGDGTFAPSRGLSLGELATVLSKTFGYSARVSAEVTPSWADEHVEKAIAAGVIDKAEVVDASITVTREQAIRYIAIAYGISPVEGNTTFVDDAAIGAEYKPYVRAFQNLGYIVGKGNNDFDPQGSYTRAEAMQVIDNTTSEIADNSVSGQTYAKDLIVRKSGVAVTDTTVKGDLIVGQGVGDGEVILDKVTINGQLLAFGGGSNSITIKGEDTIASTVASKTFGAPLRLNGSFDTITVTNGSKVIITGTVAKLIILGNAEVTLNGATVASIEITGDNVKLVVNSDSIVDNVTIGANNAVVSGAGTVKNVQVTENAKEGVEVLTVPTKVTVDAKAGAVKTKNGLIQPGKAATTSNSSSGGGGSSSGETNNGNNGGNNGNGSGNTDGLTPDSSLLNPNDNGGGEVKRLVWIIDLVDAADLTAVGYDKSEPSYSDVDENNPYFEAQFPPSEFQGAVEAIENALQNNVIAISESDGYKFYPERAATEVFAVVSAVRSLGFVYEDLQDCFEIANDVGIFTGTPSLNNLTISQASSIINAVSNIAAPISIDPFAEQIVDIKDDVIDLSGNGLIIDYSFDSYAGLGSVHLTSEAQLLFSVGDCIILPSSEAYPSGLAQKITSIAEQDDGTIIFATVLPVLEDIIGEDGINIQGHYEADISDFVVNPDLQSELGTDWNIVDTFSNNIMAMSTDLSTYSSAPFELTIKTGWKGSRQYIDVELAAVDGDDSVFLSGKIYQPTLDAKVDLEYWGLWGQDWVPIGVNYFYMAVNNEVEFGVGAETKLFDKKVKLGEFPIPLGQPALTANIIIYLEFNAKGSVSLNYSIESTVGVEYANKQLRTVNKAICDSTFEIEATVELGLRGATQLNLFGIGLADLNVRVGAGANGKLTLREVEPEQCLSVKSYLYLKLGALQEGIISDLLDLKLQIDIWGKDNSPVRGAWHFEGTPLSLVDECTFGSGSSGGGSSGGNSSGGGSPSADWPGLLPAGDLSNLSFEDGFSYWTTIGDARILSSLGVVSPTHISRMAILGTGFGAVNDSDSRLARTFVVPSGTKYLTFDYNFVSEEPMRFVGSIFDDTVIFSVIVDGIEHEIKSEAVNTSEWKCMGCGKTMPKDSTIECCVGSSFDYFPGGKDSTYNTGWKSLSIDVSAYTEFTLLVRIVDEGDSIYDSAVLLDNMRFTNSAVSLAASIDSFTTFAAIESDSLADNKSELENLLDYAKSIDTSSYSLESSETLSDVIHRSEITLADSTVTQKNVDVILAALQTAIDELR